MLEEGFAVIPARCFLLCKSLSRVDFPSTLKAICETAFYDCPFVSVDLPEGLEYIGHEPFKSDAITSVSLPKSLKYIMRSDRKFDYGSDTIISGDNIASVTIAEGFAPTLIIKGNQDNAQTNARNLIAGQKPMQTISIQRQLAAIKLQPVKLEAVTSASGGKKDFSIRYGDYAGSYVFTESGRAFYDDLLSCGFSVSAALAICVRYRR